MKQKTVWLICAVLWTVIMALRVITTQNALVSGYHVIASAVFWGLFFAQNYCDKRGEAGKKLMKRISMIAVAVVIALTLTVITR